MWTRTWQTRHTIGRAMIALLVSGCLATVMAQYPAASGPVVSPTDATAAVIPAGETPMPFDQSLDKVSQVFLDLLTILQTQGADAARQFASDQGLMTKLDEVRVTLTLDTDDQSVVDETVIAIGGIRGRVTATFDDTIELVVPVQTIVDSVSQAVQNTGSSSFFQSLADVAHVTSIRRTPIARPALGMNLGQ